MTLVIGCRNWVGYFLNQNMLAVDDEINGIDYDEELGVVIVRPRETDFEAKQRKIRTRA